MGRRGRRPCGLNWCGPGPNAMSKCSRFFGGVPKRLVPDNLRTGVALHDMHDPKINRSYAELANHLRHIASDPARQTPRQPAEVA